MRYIMPLLVVIILLVPSVAIYSPDTNIWRDWNAEEYTNCRSGPQMYQDEMGGWWMQDGGEDFEGGAFDGMLIENGTIRLETYFEPGEWYWEQVFTVSDPRQRDGHAMAYDPVNKKVVLFGNSGANNDETWIFDTSQHIWSQVAVEGPSGRYGHAMVYDELNKNILLFGGIASPGGYRGDTWTFDTTTSIWTKISDSGPDPRSHHAMAYDTDNNKVVLFGGYNPGVDGTYLSDTWILDVSDYSWNQVGGMGPDGRRYHSMIYDRGSKKIVIFGGDGQPHHYGDTWTFNTTQNIWMQVASSGPSERELHAMIYDQKNERTIMFGGSLSTSKDSNTYIYRCTTNVWSQLSIYGPCGRSGHSMAYDSVNGNVILYSGGSTNEGAYETWLLHSSPKYLEGGTYTSTAITLPSDLAWNDLVINATEPNGTKLTVSIMDADTGLYIPEYRDMEPRHVDLSNLEFGSIKLRCHFEGDGINTPALDSWKIIWKKKVPKPEYLGGIPSNVPVMEDTPKPAILDLLDYFGETRSNEFIYQIESITDNLNIHVEINSSYLDVTYLENNWTGKTDLVVNCTNAYGESVSSDKFSIVVQRVDDAPVWSSGPPPVSIDEDGVFTSPSSYLDFLIDAENDMLGLSAVCDITNISIQMSPEGYLTVIPKKDFFGSAIITITASEVYNPALKAVASVNLKINGINDDPSIKLLSPGDGAVYNDTNITLSWEAEDIDTAVENITFELFFGETKTPSLHMSDLTESSMDLTGLSDKTTYYWYLVVKDGDGGKTTSPIWSFNIDTESRVIPGATETDTGDLNVTIEVDTTRVMVEQGSETSFNLDIKNDGEKPVTLTIVTSGSISPCLSLNNFITLSPLEKKMEIVKVTRTALMEPGNYTISLVFVSSDGMKYVSVPLWIQENRSTTDETKNGDDDDPVDSTQTKTDEKGEDYLWLILVIVFLLLLVILLAVMGTINNSKLRNRVNELEKSGNKDEVLEGDAYIPQKTSFQPEIEERTQIPVSPGPYQPLKFDDQPFKPRVATFQSPQSPAPQLPTSQPVLPADVSPVATQPIPEQDLSEILGTTPAESPTQSPIPPQISESLQTPIGPFVQLPSNTGVAPLQEQKMLPENAIGAPPPPQT